MKYNRIYLILIALFGAAGAALRSLSLLYGVEPETGLPIPGYLPASVLTVLTVCVIALFAVLGRTWFGSANGCPFEQLFTGMGKPAALLCAAAAAGMTVFSAFSISYLPELLLEQTVDLNNSVLYPSPLLAAAVAVLWVLGLCSGICLFILSLAQLRSSPVSRRTGMYLTIPMFWLCLDLIMLYHENSGNPILSEYSYALLLVIALMISFYSIAGFLFSSKPSTSRFCAASAIAVYLACTQIGGTFLWCLFSDNTISAQFGITGTMHLIVYACAILFLFVYLIHVLRHIPAIHTESSTDTET